jgi:hypothetical protein
MKGGRRKRRRRDKKERGRRKKGEGRKKKGERRGGAGEGDGEDRKSYSEGAQRRQLLFV